MRERVSPAEALADIEQLAERQLSDVVAWHAEGHDPAPLDDDPLGKIHWSNFELWHAEDRARRDDRGTAYVRDAKRAIDRLNQARNDAIAAADQAILDGLGPFDPDGPMHTETPGMIIDRLSIAALRLYHMRELAEGDTLQPAERAAFARRADLIALQRRDLTAAFAAFVEELRAGRRGFRLYAQFKMYNDPRQNPELAESLRAQARDGGASG